MNNKEIIEKFYTSFSEGNSKGMTECYHKNVVFQDPVFGTLKGEKAFKMWEMLLSRKTDTTKISFENIVTNNDTGSVNWKAEYLYGKQKREVTNLVSANFKFKDGFIIQHIDTFDLYKWTKQAMGPVGYLMGWSTFMKNKIQKTTNEQLATYMSK